MYDFRKLIEKDCKSSIVSTCIVNSVLWTSIHHVEYVSSPQSGVLTETPMGIKNDIEQEYMSALPQPI